MRALPELFDLRVKARSLAYLFTAGAGLGLVTLAFPHDDEVRDLQLVVLAGIAVSIAGIVYVQADRIRGWHLHLTLALGTLILTFANYYVGESSLYPLLYTWTALYAFYFFPLGTALGHVAFIAVCYSVLLAIQDPPSPVVRGLLAVGTPMVAGLLISRLLERVGVEAAHAEQRERALRQSEARTRLVLDSAPDAFVTTDSDGVILTWNVAAERMFGWSAAEAIGKPMRSLIIPPEFRDRDNQRHLELIETEGTVATQVYDMVLERRNGERFDGEATVSRVVVGSDVLLSGFLRDVTERQRRQEEREELVRAQAARAEAERVADMVSGIQVLVDAALQSASPEEIVTDLVAGVQRVLGADAVAIFLADEDDRLRLGASSCGTPPGSVDPIPFGDGIAGRVAQSREPLFAQDPDPAELRDPGLRRLKIDSLVAVPMLARDTVIGVFEVCASPPHRFAADDLGMLRLAADRVALAIAHARVYEREHDVAVTLQRSLLPERLPQLPGLEVAAEYLPAATEPGVGGDWYDVIPISGGAAAGLVMGDVAGKGLAAASMVGRLRSALRAYALEGHDPAMVVQQLNRLMWTDAGESQMVTLLYLVVDPAAGVARWVNAGHLPPLLVGGNGRPRFLEGSSSVPLGVLPFPSYEEVSVAMEPGSKLVLYTDGLVEVPGAHIDEGMSRLLQHVKSAPDEPKALCRYLLGQLVPARGASDDVAVLTLRSVPIGDHFRVTFANSPESLASMRSLLRRWLLNAGGGEQEIAEITTACSEAATNAIEHAGSSDDEPFEVTGRIRKHEVDITVRDFGAWRTPRGGDQGRGLSLMRALMDSVDVTPTPVGTTVRLERALRGNGGPG